MSFLVIAIILLIAISAILFMYRYKKPVSSKLHKLIERDNPFCSVHHAKNIIEHAGIKEGMVVLDAGCGPGRVAIPAAMKVGATGLVVAMDLQQEMLDYAREKSDKVGLTNIRFHRAGLGEGTLEKERFDRAILVCVLGEIPNQESALREIFNALKPGGVLSVTEILFDPDYKSRKTVLKLALGAGFQEEKRFGNWVSYTMNFVKP